MRDFICPNCGQRLAFENSACLACGGRLGFSLDEMALLVIGDGYTAAPGTVAADQYEWCANRHVAQCNWLVPVRTVRQLCQSCALTRTRPCDADRAALAAFAAAEKAKRRLIVELRELRLPILDRVADPDFGLAFDLLSSAEQKVVTGHAGGIITLDLAESDDVHREQLRVEMDEPYRTLLGHCRHEIGHYYFYRLIEPSPMNLAQFHALFGDPNADYQTALDRHYGQGPPHGWQREHISSYATMHAAEDWAETFAHYLHIRDTLDTAAAFSFASAAGTYERRFVGRRGFDTMIAMWLPLAWALNMVNRSMGKDDLYPFVLPSAVQNKMRFIHAVIDEQANPPRQLAAAA
ncbi:putative zinc-binding metallopeptidase [Mycobacterium sp.]|uniref:zinc-binding metallopeptidase family protein n=1 Tax=Mycobacterium sp. TaxID=1785 RepID=UPI0025DF0E8F|nr:putative zinc-binding metallopeptidase [Mycobacterium sp.]